MSYATLAIAALLSTATARPTTTDDARSLTGKNSVPSPSTVTVLQDQPVFNTDEARKLAARRLPMSGADAEIWGATSHVTSSDEARSAIAAASHRDAEEQTASQTEPKSAQAPKARRSQ